MKKPETLRRVLLAHVLNNEAGKLSLFIDRGRIAARKTGSLSFEYRYDLNVVVQDYAGSIDALMLPVLAWVAEQQPDLLDRAPNEPFAFDSEILDGDRADVSITLELTERVLVTGAPGSFAFEHLDDAPPTDAFPGVCGVNLWQGILEDAHDGATILVP